MLQSAKLKYLFPIILFGTFFLDGALNQIFSAVLFQYPYSMICNLTLMWFVMGIFFEGESQINFTLWAFVIGIVFDWYYTGVFGVNTFIIPLVVMFVREVRLYVNTSFLIVMVLDTLAMALYNVLFYAVFQAISFWQTCRQAFLLGIRFFPTIILNLALFVVFILPNQDLLSADPGN